MPRAYDIVKSPQDLRHLSWTEAAFSSGTGGMLLKAREQTGKSLWYYKLSSYDSYRGVYGHECVNELIASRLLDVLGFPHVRYRLINARISIDGHEVQTWICRSASFRRTGEGKMGLDTFFDLHRQGSESPLDLCERYGWTEQIRQMASFDYLIANRDRHGANIEVLRSRDGSIRLAPLFDNGLSLVFSCLDNQDQVRAFAPLTDVPANNYLGSHSLEQNLQIIGLPHEMGTLQPAHRDMLLRGLDDILSPVHLSKIWDIVWERWCALENLRDH